MRSAPALLLATTLLSTGCPTDSATLERCDIEAPGFGTLDTAGTRIVDQHDREVT